MPLAQYTRDAETIPADRALTKLAEGSTEFDTRDQKGRTVGYAWTVSAVKVTVLTDENRGTRRSWHAHLTARPLEYFQVWGSPTRDGKRYGPAFNTHDVATREEADKLVAKRIENARKSNAKKFEKVAA